MKIIEKRTNLLTFSKEFKNPYPSYCVNLARSLMRFYTEINSEIMSKSWSHVSYDAIYRSAYIARSQIVLMPHCSPHNFLCEWKQDGLCCHLVSGFARFAFTFMNILVPDSERSLPGCWIMLVSKWGTFCIIESVLTTLSNSMQISDHFNSHCNITWTLCEINNERPLTEIRTRR